MKFNELGRSFFRKMVQIRSNFATTCITTGTRGAKLPVDATFSGRSMVEMLGVLAIIGVLSVGAIAGYSKAMFKYKSNKQAEQLSTIISAVSRYQNDLRLNDGSTDAFQLIPLLKKLHEIPEDMYYPNNDKLIQDVFKVIYSVYHHDTGYIGISSSIPTDAYSVNICRNMYTVAKEFHNEISTIQFAVYQTDYVNNQRTSVYGDKMCQNNQQCLRDLKISDIDNICQQCTGNKQCALLIIFHKFHSTY